jgi:hypothetical protein
MQAVVELNGYAEVTGAELRFRPLLDEIRVRALPATVVLRAVWRTEPGDDDPPGYLPIARLLLDHTEPDAASELGQLPELFREPLERWDAAGIIFAAYTLHLHAAGEHRVEFPKAELEPITLQVRVDE